MMAEETIYDMLCRSVKQYGPRRALGWKEGGQYHYLTYAELGERVRRFRGGLAALGMKKGDRIALLSYNCMEWAIADLSAQSIGAITVPIYHTLPTPQVEHIVRDSAARILLVENEKQLTKAQELRPRVDTLEHVVLMRGKAPEGVLSFEEVMAFGEESPLQEADLNAQAVHVAPEDIATFIYTSGTTGDPKGAMLTHRALLYTGTAARQIVHLDENDVFLSFLPLSHIIERVGGYYLPLSIGALIVYSEGPFAVANELPVVQPTIFLCVPRLYESAQEKLQDYVAKLPKGHRQLFVWAVNIGLACAQSRHEKSGRGLIRGVLQAVADRLVLRKVRQKVAGNRLRFFVSGGAPLNPTTGMFFEALGLPILEGYGLTELPVISLNRPGEAEWGTVGPPLPGIEVKIAEDGEILARGPSVMQGYFGKPEATAEAIDSEGWLHTGDIGEVTADGKLRITDRKKDIIVLANGKNVAPQPIEARLKQSPFIQEAVLIGDRQSGIVALVVPAFDRLRDWAQQNALPAADTEELLKRTETRILIKEEIDRLSEHLADFERIKRFALLSEPFSIETGELTPTLKVKRRVVREKYAALIEQMARSV
jgi:long-chain acyl-CoA synthetase